MNNDTTLSSLSSPSTSDNVPSQRNLWPTAKRLIQVAVFVAIGATASAIHRRGR